jgi:hypothetical protein
MRGVIVKAERIYKHYNKRSPKDISNTQVPYPLDKGNIFLSVTFKLLCCGDL